MPPAVVAQPSPSPATALSPPSGDGLSRTQRAARRRATRRRRAVLMSALSVVAMVAASAMAAAFTGSSPAERSALTSAPDTTASSTPSSTAQARATGGTTLHDAGKGIPPTTAASLASPSWFSAAGSTAAAALRAPSAATVGAPAAASVGAPALTPVGVTGSGATSATGCSVSAILVPSCGAWWGVSPGGSGDPAAGVAQFERLTGAPTDIYHGYHSLGEMFPTPEEIAVARDPQRHRLLLLSLFMSSGGTTWRGVANGSQDAYLARLATYIRSTYRDKFFLTIHHEPENDVIPTAGSGMQATDFHDMFRHVVTFMRSQGVSNAVWVVNFQGTQKFKLDPWWPQMYPGDDVVDWIGWDSYSCVAVGPGTPCPDFSHIMNRRFSPSSPWLGMYHWATSNHPSKPIFICELGVQNPGDDRKAAVLRSIGTQISSFPQIKAIAYWNSGDSHGANITYGPGAVAAAATTAQNAWFRQSPP